MITLTWFEALRVVSDAIHELTRGRQGVRYINGDRPVYTDSSGKQFRGEHSTETALVFYGVLWNKLKQHDGEGLAKVVARLESENPALLFAGKYTLDAIEELASRKAGWEEAMTQGREQAEEFIKYTSDVWWAMDQSGWHINNAPFEGR